MKKIFIVSFASILMLTGCGEMDTLSCTYDNTMSNGSSKVSYDIDHNNNSIKKVRITYDYNFAMTDGNNTGNTTNNDTTRSNDNNQIDGVGTGTDGTTNDTDSGNDGIVDGIVGSAIDAIVGGVTDVILDAAGLRDRHQTVQNTYGNINGFSVANTTDVDNNYKVTYIIDYNTISDTDLARFNLSRDLDTMRNNYTNQGFTCK